MPTAPQSYSTASFEELTTHLSPGSSVCFTFIGGDKTERQEALTTLTEALPYTLHQVQSDSLIGERHIETQGNLREMFDDAGDAEGNILVFDNADALYELPGAQEEKHAEEEGDEEAMTPIEYVFERVDSFNGIVVLIFKNADYADHTSKQDNVDYVIEF